jgi:hypothetical protein
MSNKCRVLSSDIELSKYIAEQARRYFSNPQNQEDARQEAWAKLAGLKRAYPMEKRQAARLAIKALYMRVYRQRLREG